MPGEVSSPKVDASGTPAHFLIFHPPGAARLSDSAQATRQARCNYGVLSET
jgi:hypothetical protein